MNLKSFTFTVAAAAALSLLPSKASAWGGAHSFSAHGASGGSISHTGATRGGWGGWSHAGTTTVTGRYGHSYTVSSAGTHYNGGYYGGGYHYGGYYGGCYGGGFAAGAVAGAAVGAAATSAAYNSAYYPYYPAPGVYYPPGYVY